MRIQATYTTSIQHTHIYTNTIQTHTHRQTYDWRKVEGLTDGPLRKELDAQSIFSSLELFHSTQSGFDAIK